MIEKSWRYLPVVLATVGMTALALHQPVRRLLAGGSVGTAIAEQHRLVRQYVTGLQESEPLRRALSTAKSVGFVSDTPVDIRARGVVELRYSLAQYALAPTLVTTTGAEEFVLATFSAPQQLAAYLENPRIELLERVNPSTALVRTRPH